MRRTAIKPKRLYELAREYMAVRHVTVSHPEGGRPRTYDDALILTIACLQNLNQYSFREALEYCEDYFKELPALSTYHDRLKLLTSDIAQGFIEHIGEKIKETNKKTSNDKGRLFVMDGTGFSYHDVYPMKLHRGTEIRKIKTHVKVGVLIGFAGSKRYVVSAAAGKSYAGDTTLIQPLLWIRDMILLFQSSATEPGWLKTRSELHPTKMPKTILSTNKEPSLRACLAM